MKTVTVNELAAALSTLPDNTKVYLSKDPEGNGYSTIDIPNSLSLIEQDGVLILYPWEMTEIDDIAPKYMAEDEDE